MVSTRKGTKKKDRAHIVTSKDLRLGAYLAISAIAILSIRYQVSIGLLVLLHTGSWYITSLLRR